MRRCTTLQSALNCIPSCPYTRSENFPTPRQFLFPFSFKPTRIFEAHPSLIPQGVNGKDIRHRHACIILAFPFLLSPEVGKAGDPKVLNPV